MEQLAALAARTDTSLDEQRAIYLRTRWLKRQVLLSNPQMQFGQLLFAKRVPTSYSHLVMQYFGWRARPGGGLFVLENPGRSLAARDLLDGQLAGGNVLEPRLSYDAQRIIFSFSKCTPEDPFYHIYEVRTDGTGLRQLTDGEYEDLMPNYLPDGGIVFSSTRRKGHARCFGGQFGPRWHVYTLHRMDADGANIRTLSYHETNEWFPTVASTGHILYSRWDYVDRHPVLHQNLWACRPDGTNPVALWGNHTQTPHCTFQLQPIPNTTQIVFTASAHHSITGGSVAIVSPHRGNNGEQALTRITPEVPFPEAEGGINEYYDAPWPLSEDCFLVGYSPKPLIMEPQANDPAALGIYLLDRRGNRELIYRDPAIGSSHPLPLVPRRCLRSCPACCRPTRRRPVNWSCRTSIKAWAMTSRAAASRPCGSSRFCPRRRRWPTGRASGWPAKSRRGRSWARCRSSRMDRRDSSSRPSSPSCSRPWTRTVWPIRRCVPLPTCSPAKRSPASAVTNAGPTRRSAGRSWRCSVRRRRSSLAPTGRCPSRTFAWCSRSSTNIASAATAARRWKRAST